MAYRLTLQNPEFMWTKTKSRSIVVRTKDEYDDLFKDDYVALIKGYINYDHVTLSACDAETVMTDDLDIETFYINDTVNLNHNKFARNGEVDFSIDGVQLHTSAKVELTNPKLALEDCHGDEIYDDLYARSNHFITRNHLYTKPKEATVYSKLVNYGSFDIEGPYWEDLDNPNEHMFIDVHLPYSEYEARREVYEAESCDNELNQLIQRFNDHFDEQIQFYKEYNDVRNADIPNQFKIQSKVDVEDNDYYSLMCNIRDYFKQNFNNLSAQHLEVLKNVKDPHTFIENICGGNLNMSFEFEAFDHLTDHVFVRTFFRVDLEDIAEATNYDAVKFMKIVVTLLKASKNELSISDIADFTVQANFSQQINRDFDLEQALNGINQIRESTIEDVISCYNFVIKDNAVLTWYFTAGEPNMEDDNEDAYYSEIIIEKVTD